MRIKKIASFIKPCNCIYDVGSDHAKLAIFLLHNKIVDHVVNIEKNKKPLNVTINAVTKNGFFDYTTNIENDGLKNISSLVNLKPKYICISGMGGINIADILNNADKKLSINKLILCPNNNSDKVRQWLCDNNFEIYDENFILDHGKYYFIICAVKRKKHYPLLQNEIFFGPINIKNHELIFEVYLNKIKTDIKQRNSNKLSLAQQKLYNNIIKTIKQWNQKK